MDLLTWILLLAWMLKRIQDTSYRDMKNHIFKRDVPFGLKKPIFLRVPSNVFHNDDNSTSCALRTQYLDQAYREEQDLTAPYFFNRIDVRTTSRTLNCNF